MLNNIEANVGSSVEYAVKARDDIKGVRESQKKARYVSLGFKKYYTNFKTETSPKKRII